MRPLSTETSEGHLSARLVMFVGFGAALWVIYPTLQSLVLGCITRAAW